MSPNFAFFPACMSRNLGTSFPIGKTNGFLAVFPLITFFFLGSILRIKTWPTSLYESVRTLGVLDVDE